MQKKYLIAGLASGLVPAGLVCAQDSPVPTGPHWDGNPGDDNVLIIGTGFDPNGSLDPNVVLGVAPWSNVNGFVHTPDYQTIDDGLLWNCTDGTDIPYWWFDDVDLGLPWELYDPCRSYSNWCA